MPAERERRIDYEYVTKRKCHRSTDIEVCPRKISYADTKPSERSHLGVELVVAKVQGGVDWLKRLKVDINFLLLALVCHNGATVNNQTIGWH